MRATYRGLDYQNETAPIVREWIMRRQLAKQGYRFDGETLSPLVAHCFSEIAAAVDECMREEVKSGR